MIPLGPIELTPVDLLLILAFHSSRLLEYVLPVPVALATVAYRQAVRHRSLSILGAALLGLLLTAATHVALMLAFDDSVAPLTWLPGFTLAWFLHRRRPRAQATLGGTTRAGGSG